MSASPVVLLSGATGRIGKILTTALIQEGYLVAGISRKDEETPQAGYIPLRADLHAPDAAESIRAALDTQQLNPAHFIHAACDLENIISGDSLSMPAENFHKEFHMAVVAPYAVSMMLLARGGLETITNISSMYGNVAVNTGLYAEGETPSRIHYNTAKAAQIHFTKDLAVRLAPKGVRVNCVSYGGVKGRTPDAFQARYAKLCPQGRMLDDADLAEPVCFLLRPGASGVVGHNIVVDGGWTVW
ncbi:MAG: SDR family oxidoreductase [Alphaproteobacteria bacterium]|jgi:NAD(P)-dependent dehydrogenase (short-subunit alcohol dehydrogenase family)|nr:SDR family oxidoreductase [Alphaproteobacteria bacterium]